ncbi:MAG TPA: NAD(P)/FAD-dependent oxidoreductase [Rhizorhapis sp.]|nr:NAD(P)/FAD-dependent oxidoreductase [Rhizorhapis sp.]
MTRIGAAVIGAGVVGLAVARRFARLGLETVIVDGEADFGTWTSARNSEVIHAGIYYPIESLKAELCVRGKKLLYDYCYARDLPCRQCGKLIFAATPGQTAALDAILAAAEGAGVTDLRRLDAQEVRSLEPMLGCHEALLSPSTGIIDSHAYMQSLLGEAEDCGAQFARQSRVTGLSRRRDGWGVHIGGEAEPAAIASLVVNAAGLTAHLLARQTQGLASEHVPQVRYARGVYFTYSGRAPFSHLVYPVPVPGGLGTHLTLDMASSARFGPDVEWIEEIDYGVDPARHAGFLAAARLIWPDLDPERLVPGYAGIRPKLSGPGEPAADFWVSGPQDHGLPGLVNLFGIESPGLTASLALADLVAEKLGLGWETDIDASR